MKKYLIVLFVLFLSASVFAQKDSLASKNKKGGNDETGDKPNIGRLLDEIRADIEDAADVISAKMSGRDKKKVLNYLDHALDMVDDVEGSIGGGSGHGGGHGGGGGYYGLPPVPDPAFKEILDAVNREAFAQARLNIIEVAGRGGAFTIAQIVKLINAFNFREEQISVVRLLYPTSYDKYNAYKLINAFTFQDDKDAVTRIITGK